MKNVKGTKNVQNSKKSSNSIHSNSQNTHARSNHIDTTSPISLLGMFNTDHTPKIVYVCAPYRPLSKDPEKAAAELKENIRNTRMACTLVSIMNEMPVSSALIYPQFLDDNDPIDRKKGIQYGIRLLESADELWIVGDRITAGMRQEIDAAKELQIPIRFMGDPYEEAEKLLQKIEELEKCIPDDDEGADDKGAAEDGNSADEEESDGSWRDHVQDVFDCLMCPCSGIDSPDEFLENFERYFWIGFPECKADEENDPLNFGDEDGCSGDDDEDNEGAEDETEDDEDDEDSSNDFDDFLDDLIDALEIVRELCGEED